MGKNKQLQCTYIPGHCSMREELIWVWAGICSGKIIWFKYTVKFILLKNAARQRSNFWAQQGRWRKTGSDHKHRKVTVKEVGQGHPEALTLSDLSKHRQIHSTVQNRHFILQNWTELKNQCISQLQECHVTCRMWLVFSSTFSSLLNCPLSDG